MKTITNYPVIDAVLEAAQDVIDRQVFLRKTIAKEIQECFTARDEEYYRLEIVASLIKALANYTLKTDEISDLSVSTSKGQVNITCNIIRDGQSYFLYTYTIIAKGEIQRAHLRYLVQTTLRKISSSTALDGIKATQKRMKAEDRINEEIKHLEGAVARYTKEAEELEAKTEEQIIADYNQFWIERFGTSPRFEYLSEGAKQVYGTEEAYLTKCRKDEQEAIVSTRQRAKSARYNTKECLKRINKLKTKLEQL